MKCERCHGSGELENWNGGGLSQECPACKGEGHTPDYQEPAPKVDRAAIFCAVVRQHCVTHAGDTCQTLTWITDLLESKGIMP